MTTFHPVTSPESDSRAIDERIASLGDWRGETLAQIRRLVKEAEPEMVEEVKWRKPSNSMAGVATWSHADLICTGEPYKDKVKLTFAKGASLNDPSRLFNASLTAGTRRAIDIHERDSIDASALEDLVREAVAFNEMRKAD